MVCLENTHNRCGGAPLSVQYTQSVANLARQHNLYLHLDGARIFNAAAALDVEARELAGPADSVTICLSKGLCAPVGSVVCGSREFIARAHRVRKLLGGGMRQAGVIAAAGILALETMTVRLGEDHDRAKRLALGLAKLPGIVLDPGSPLTNMVFLNLDKSLPLTATQIEDALWERGVRVSAVSERRFRLVTHYWIDDDKVDVAVAAFAEVLQNAHQAV
jgi:threonine aldolase